MVHAATHDKCGAGRRVRITRACGRSADVRCWGTDRRRSAVFGLRRNVRGVPNGKPGRRSDGSRSERDTRPDNCYRRRITARSQARAASRMVPVSAVTVGRVRRTGGVVDRAVGRSRVRNAHRRRPNHVRSPVVHGTRMQCRWLLLDYEGPGRKDRGDCATTGRPHHCWNYDWLLAPATPARYVRRTLEIIEPGRSASPISTRSSRCRQ